MKQLLPVVKKGLIKSMAHITGGGFTDNIPRCLPKGVGVEVDVRKWELPGVFKWLKSVGGISSRKCLERCSLLFAFVIQMVMPPFIFVFTAELARTFNCGIGMVLVVSRENVAEVTSLLQGAGETVYEIGKVVADDKQGVKILGAETAWA